MPLRLPFKEKTNKKNRPQNTIFSVKLKSASNFPQAAPSHVCLTDDLASFLAASHAHATVDHTACLHVHARLSFKARVPHVNTSKRKCYSSEENKQMSSFVSVLWRYLRTQTISYRSYRSPSIDFCELAEEARRALNSPRPASNTFTASERSLMAA